MNTAAKGRRNEHRGRDFFKALGYKVMRSAGSFGIADLVAFGKNQVLFINGKTNQWTPKKERDLLIQWCDELTGSGIKCFAVIMRFDDGMKEPQFQIYINGSWIKGFYESCENNRCGDCKNPPVKGSKRKA